MITQCTEIIQASLDCEWSNQQTMLIELAIGSVFAVLLAAYFYKKQEEQKEGLARVERSVTEKVYSRDINSYTCDVQFNEPEGNAPDLAKNKVLKDSENWIDGIKKKSKSVIGEIEISGRGKGYELQFEKGILRITFPHLTRSFFGGIDQYTQTANIHIQTEDLELLDMIIREGDKPYWDLSWNITSKYNIHEIIPKIEEAQGRKPYSRGGTGTGQDTLWTGADYKVIELDGVVISASIYEKSVHLTCTHRKPHQGFRNAHRVFSPGKIFAILFGEVQYQEVKDMAMKSIQS